MRNRIFLILFFLFTLVTTYYGLRRSAKEQKTAMLARKAKALWILPVKCNCIRLYGVNIVIMTQQVYINYQNWLDL